MTAHICLEKICKRYPSGTTGSEILPLCDIDLEAEKGERIVLLGKSGSGKTTFLNIVGGVDTPSSGRITINAKDLSKLTPTELAVYRRQDVGFIFQSFNLFSTLTVGENIMLPLDLLGIRNEEAAREMLSAMGLDGLWDRFPEQLSGGEQQRVAIARALIKNPAIVLADEPTGNLDQETGNSILKIIDETCRGQNATLIMATHSYEALFIADRAFRLTMGCLEKVTI